MEFFDGSGNVGGSVVVRRGMGRGIRRCRVEKDAGVGTL